MYGGKLEQDFINKIHIKLIKLYLLDYFMFILNYKIDMSYVKIKLKISFEIIVDLTEIKSNNFHFNI